MPFKMTCEPDDYEGPWPEGDAMTEWVMVPREPTEQMLVALANTPCRVGWPAKAYRAMLDAAPAAPVQPVQAQGEPVEIVPRVWREALRKLTFMARTSGGSAVPDKELQAACAQAEALLSKPYNYPPAAPQQAGQFDHLAGRGIHELRTGELPAYIVSLAVGHGPSSPVVKAALDWIVSELERKTNDERALAVKLDAIRAAPQQAEPCDVCNALIAPRNATHYDADDLKAAQVRGKIIAAKLQQQQAEPVAQIGWADEFGNLFPMGAWKPTQRTHHDSHKTAWRPVFLHPPAAEAQRLRDALKPFAEIDLTTNQAVDAMDVLRARRALEGGE